MLDVLNRLVLENPKKFLLIIVALIFVLIGNPILSTKGGIPRVKGKIISKENSLVFLVISVVLLIFILPQVLDKIAEYFIINFTIYVIPLILVMSGLALCKWDKNMKWDYGIYAYGLIVLGIILLLVEIYYPGL